MLKSVQWAVGMPAVGMHRRRGHQLCSGKGQRAADRVTLPSWGLLGHSSLLKWAAAPQAQTSPLVLLYHCSSLSLISPKIDLSKR